MQVPIQRCSMIHSGRQEGVVTRTGKKHAPKQWHGQYSALRSASWASFPLQWVRVVNIVYFPGTQKATDSSLQFFSFFLPFFTCLNYWFLITLICWVFFNFTFCTCVFWEFFFAQAIGRRTNVKEIERVFKRVFFILIIHFFNHYSLCDYKLGLKRM